MDRETLLSQLAQALPEVVHTLTPQGRVQGEAERRGW
ncbi:YidB family protein [Methylobacterium sp. J-088]